MIKFIKLDAYMYFIDGTYTKMKECFQDFFDEQVIKSPETTAVICESSRLTYRELYERSNQIANYLQSLGVKPNELVGICVNRSVDMVVGILGVLKSGGAYVPIDPAYPRERLSFILDDANVQVVLTQTELLNVLPGQVAYIVCLDDDRSGVKEQPKTSPARYASRENLAYVIYTSGSTGKPKGVMITHSNLCNFVRIACQALDVTSQDVYLQTASISYALSVRQLVVPLSYGATLVIANQEQMRDPLPLFELIKQREITLMDMVPSFWRTCIHRLDGLSLAERNDLMNNRLRRIVSIGEALLSDIPRDWETKVGHHAKLVNIFGQTETTGVVAVYPISSENSNKVTTVPIGWSVPDTELYILDSNLQVVPADVVGELCVSSPCVALGYLNRPELTAEKFIPNPFDDHGGTRLYRTGDMARRRADGCVEFLGRSDFQVKIRGQRLELGEVEAVLSEHETVQACVAVMHGDQPDSKYLVTFVVPAPNQEYSANELRRFMRQRVPDYMIPAMVVFVDTFPLTPNGKVNRLIFSDPDFIRSNPLQYGIRFLQIEKQDINRLDHQRDLVEPRNPVESTIAGIWEDLLGIKRVGIHENFFDLGGHSLLAVRMFSRFEQEFGSRLPLTVLFTAATVAKLAEVIEHYDERKNTWSPVVPIQTGGVETPFFAIHGHEGGVLFWRDLVAYLPGDQPFYAVQSQGVDGLTPALTRIEDMARLYVSEIRKIQPVGPYYLGGYSLGGEIAFEMAQQFCAQGERVALLVLFDTANPTQGLRYVVREKHESLAVARKTNIRSIQSDLWKLKINGHIHNVLDLSTSEWFGYTSSQIKHRVTRRWVYSQAKIFHFLGRRLPAKLLLQYLRFKHSQALHAYLPVPYPGKVTLFRATGSLDANPLDSHTGWESLVSGGLEVHVIRGTHEIFNSGSVKEVAQKLTECLAEARVR